MLQLRSAEHLQVAEKYGDNYFGCIYSKTKSIFRVFAPRAKQIHLILFEGYGTGNHLTYKMHSGRNGVWHVELMGDFKDRLYGYKVTPPDDGLPFEVTDNVIADPYSKWVVCQNNYSQMPLSLIFEPEPFDWEEDDFRSPGDPRDLVIYETHIRDLLGINWEPEHDGSVYESYSHASKSTMAYLSTLNINAIELLPLHKFAYKEPPYQIETEHGVKNTWNPYAKNYWGYMTSFFFMPESRFSLRSTPGEGDVYGQAIDGLNQFKQMVKTLHRQGLTVILDVVYNHASQYDLNPLKYLDRMYYFRHDSEHNYTSYSGCGNDIRTEAPMARKLIVDSVLYWMKEFHIDGFRFDLAHLIDRETLMIIRQEARKINPNVVLIAEPWGGGYNPAGFSEIGWPSWNDQIRNGIKGSDPVHGAGLIFGKWQYETSRQSVENFVRGTLLGAANGRYYRSSHSVNYLESHDGYTIGDFIRLVYNPDLAHTTLHDKNIIRTLEGPELNSARLAIFILMISQGIAMIHAGQEYARTKLIVKADENDPDAGKFDHNSYNKDNETNYLDFDDIKSNQDLFNYSIGLIKLRKSSSALKKSKPEAIQFHSYEDPLFFTFNISNHGTDDPFEYLISFNANPFREHEIKLPDGFWQLMVTESIASDVPISVISGILKVGPLSGILVRREVIHENIQT